MHFHIQIKILNCQIRLYASSFSEIKPSNQQISYVGADTWKPNNKDDEIKAAKLCNRFYCRFRAH